MHVSYNYDTILKVNKHTLQQYKIYYYIKGILTKNYFIPFLEIVYSNLICSSQFPSAASLRCNFKEKNTSTVLKLIKRKL